MGLLDTKYRKTLYNECVIDNETNTVIFPFNKEWEDYKKWVSMRPVEHNKINIEVEKLRRWNGGLPHKDYLTEEVYTEDGVLYTRKRLANLKDKKNYTFTKFYPNGNIKKEQVYEDTLKWEMEYLADTTPLKGLEYDGDIEIRKTFHSKTGKLKLRISTQDTTITTTHYDESEYLTYLEIKTPSRITEETYWKNSTNIHTKIVTAGTGKQFEEYFTNGKLRAKGQLTLKEKMNGEWIYNQLNGKVESEHTFDNGKLINNSKIYADDGRIIHNIEHE